MVNKNRSVSKKMFLEDSTSSLSQKNRNLAEDEKFKTLVDASPDCIKILDTKGKITFMNSNGLKEHQLRGNQAIGWDWMGSIKKEYRAKVKEALKSSFKGKTSRVEFEHIGGGWCDMTLSPINGDWGVTNILAVSRNITEKKEIEEKLKEDEEKYKQITEKVDDGIYQIDAEGNFTFVNDSYAKLFGYKKNEIIGKSFKIVVPNSQLLLAQKKLKEILSGKTVIGDFVLKKKNGSEFVVFFSAVPVMQEGKVVGTIGVVRDVTKKREAEEKVIESELKFRRLFEAAQDAILILNAKTGKIEDSNPYVQNLLEYSAKELIGKHVWEISPINDIIANKAKLIELQKKGYVHYEDLPLETKSGKKVHVEFVSNVYGLNGKQVIQCNIRDITNRKETEEKLELFKLGFEKSPNSQMIVKYSSVEILLIMSCLLR